MAGGFPSEALVIDLIKRGETETLKKLLTPAVYGYLAGFLVLFIVSMIVQYKTRTEEDKEKLDDNYKYFNGKQK